MSRRRTCSGFCSSSPSSCCWSASSLAARPCELDQRRKGTREGDLLTAPLGAGGEGRRSSSTPCCEPLRWRPSSRARLTPRRRKPVPVTKQVTAQTPSSVLSSALPAKGTRQGLVPLALASGGLSALPEDRLEMLPARLVGGNDRERGGGAVSVMRVTAKRRHRVLAGGRSYPIEAEAFGGDAALAARELATSRAGTRSPASSADRYPERAALARRLGGMRAALAGRDGSRRIDGGPRLTPFPL
jgi:hypothetical protein